MELKKYFQPFLKWWWLIAAATLIAAAVSFIATRGQPDVYEARTTLMIGRLMSDPNPTTGELVLGQELAAAYADIAKRQLVRDATMKALDIRRLPEYQAQALLNTQILEIYVKDQDPALAQQVANELAHQLTLLSPTNVQSEDQDHQEFLNSQIDNLETQIEETQAQIDQLQLDLGNMISAQEITDAKTQLFGLETKLTTLQTNYANLISTTDQGASNTLNIIEPAALPARPVASTELTTIVLAAMVGFMLSTGAAYLLEYLDGSIKASEDIEEIFQAPILGSIMEVPRKKKEKPFSVVDNPRHIVTEGFRTLRTNLQFSNEDKPIKTILITSAGGNEGKSWLAANLALSLSQEDKRVVLVDADVRNPSQHKFFNLEKGNGLIDLILGQGKVRDVIKFHNGNNVGLITAGNMPEQPRDLLSIKKIDKVLPALDELVDYVIIDGPPFFIADAAVLASKVDAVIVVVRPGYTQKNAARAMINQLKLAGATLAGVAINRISPREMKNFYKYGYGSLENYLALSTVKKQKPLRKAASVK
jgi:capsular exopolysaccharide synthesis family protein